MGVHGWCIAAGLGVAAALAGCAADAQAPPSRIPEFARPSLLERDGSWSGDWIAYRQLTRDDFRASAPPDRVLHGASQVGAAACASIRAQPGARLDVERRADRVVVEPQGLVFEALFDRACSWWNDANDALPGAYVLEHEQIHFALFELEARDLTRRVGRVARTSAPADADPRQLAERVQQEIDAELERASQAVLRRSLEFDEDTSFAYEPESQTRWREQVERELAESR